MTWKFKLTLIPSTVLGVIAPTTGIMASLRVDKGPSKYLKRANTIHDRLVKILDAAKEGQKFAGNKTCEEGEDALKQLFAELQNTARQLYELANSLIQDPSLAQSHYVQQAANNAKEVLLRMRILD